MHETRLSFAGLAPRHRTLALCLAEARPQVQAAFLLRFACGAVLAGPGAHAALTGRTVAGLLVWECAVVAIYLYNGAVDVSGDRVNGSRRPIARGDLAPGRATRWAAGFTAVALAAAPVLGARFVLATAAFLVLGALYSIHPFDLRKRPLGASVTGLGAGLVTFFAGGLAVQEQPTAPLAVLAVAMSLWMGIVGATTKDFADRAGDAVDGRRTLVRLLGEDAVRRFVAVAAPTLGVAFVAVAWYVAPLPLLPPALATLAGGVLVGMRAATRPAGPAIAVRPRPDGPYRAFMGTQLITLVLVLGVAGAAATG